MKATNFLIAIICFISLSNYSSAQAPNTWIQKANFGGTTREAAVGFSIGSKGYIGTGDDVNGEKNDFWEYDTISNAWTQKANVGGGTRYRAVGFSIGMKGYIGLGQNGLGDKNDFWEYNPATNTWTQKANYSGSGRIDAVGFSVGAKGYIGTGATQTGIENNDFWEYDPNTNVWIQKANFGGTARSGAVGFNIQSKGYLGTGRDINNNGDNDFWEYDPNTNTWTQKANAGGGVRMSAVGFGIGTKGYIGTGIDYYGYCNDFWEYDPSTNFWIQKANFGGTVRFAAVGFSIGANGYIGTGWDANGYRNDFWKYTPLCNLPASPTNTTPSANQNICTGNSTILSASGPGILGWYSASTGGTWLGGGTNFTTPILMSNTTYYVQDSTCGASLTRTSIAVTVNPLPIPTITGQNTMCVNSGYYNYTTQSGMQNYLWTVSSGGIINFGSGTNQVQVSWISAGAQTVSVTYSNGSGCNPLTPTVLNVTVNPVPGQAGSITGTDTVCAEANGVAYSVATIPNATTYVWSLPPNATVSSGGGTNSITVNYDTNAVSGNICVYGNNICGNGMVSPNFPVTVNPVPSAPNVTSNGDTLYSNSPIGNQWYFEGILIAGATSQTYIAPYNGHYWDVVTVNGCSSDTSDHELIVITGIPSHPLTSINVYPVPNDGQFYVTINMNSKESFSIYVYNSLGVRIFEESEVHFNRSLRKVIDLRHVPNGIYTVIFESNSNRTVKKIVVSK